MNTTKNKVIRIPAIEPQTSDTAATLSLAETNKLALDLAKAISKYGEDYMAELMRLYNGNVRTAIKAAELFERCHKALRH